MKLKTILLTVTICFVQSGFAGQVSDLSVVATTNPGGDGFARGNMKTARFSANDVELIGCNSSTRYDALGNPTYYGWCQARNSAGENVFCNIINKPELMEQIQGISTYSYISFSWNASGECTRVAVSTQSIYIP